MPALSPNWKQQHAQHTHESLHLSPRVQCSPSTTPSFSSPPISAQLSHLHVHVARRVFFKSHHRHVTVKRTERLIASPVFSRSFYLQQSRLPVTSEEVREIINASFPLRQQSPCLGEPNKYTHTHNTSKRRALARAREVSAKGAERGFLILLRLQRRERLPPGVCQARVGVESGERDTSALPR